MPDFAKRISLICLLFLSPAVTSSVQAETVWLSSLDLSKMTAGKGQAQADKNIQSNPISIAGEKFDKGVGTHANSVMYVKLGGQAKRFTAMVGVDDEAQAKHASIRFKIYADGQKLFDSNVMRSGQKAKAVDLNLAEVDILLLVVTSTGDGVAFDYADWADAKFDFIANPPKAVDPPIEEKIIFTPKPGPRPRINGPGVYGVRPGRPFLYRIPTTGKRPIKFRVYNLPDGLHVDKEGIIRGTILDQTKKTWHVTFHAENEFGSDEKDFRIVVGDTIALTPPMGWNHWYSYYQKITDEVVRGAADAMVASGMADAGYQYVNIDDCWAHAESVNDRNKQADRIGPLRDEKGNILCNKYFPDMKALTDFVHSKGLKAGVYASPGPLTCARYAGSWQYEAQDAKQFCDWGFDFLKYDWCTYSRVAGDKSLAGRKKPYQLMGDILKELDRDIVFNICQYGMAEVWKWGAEVGGNCWRTADDLGFDLSNYHEVALRNAKLYPYAKPGAWNDPDYLILGYMKHPRKKESPATPCPLSPNEQYSYMSLWSIMASPLFFSGDMQKLDEFTLNVLCNPEIIEVNQDPLGRQGYPVILTDEQEIWKKPMEDGSIVMGLFNRGQMQRKISFKWQDVGIEGPQKVRDLWRQKDLGVYENSFQMPVPRHGVMMIRMYPASGKNIN